MGDPYYPWYPGDYQRDTGDLSLTEHGAYRVLLDCYYMHRGLPEEESRLFRIAKAMTDEERDAVRTVSARFFANNGNGFLTNKRADLEIEKRDKFISEQKRKSALGVARRLALDEPTGEPTGEPEGEPLPSPSPSLSSTPSPKKTIKHHATHDFFKRIEAAGKQIQKLKLKGKLNVWEWTQIQVNKSVHPGAICEVLEGVIPYLQDAKNPYGYLEGTMKTIGPNWKEKEFLKEATAEASEWQQLVEMLKKARGK